MDSVEKYVDRAASAERLSTEENDPDVEAYWQRAAQLQATLALVAAIVGIRDVLIARLPS